MYLSSDQLVCGGSSLLGFQNQHGLAMSVYPISCNGEKGATANVMPCASVLTKHKLYDLQNITCTFTCDVGVTRGKRVPTTFSHKHISRIAYTNNMP